MKAWASRSYLSLIITLDALVLLRMAPHPAQLIHDLAAPRAWVADVGADAAAATLATAAVWCAAAWFGVAIAATVLAMLPGLPGRIANRASQALLPAVVHRVVAGAAGVSVILAPVAAGAQAPPPPAPTWTIPAPTWPMSAPGPAVAPPATPPPQPPAPPPPRPRSVPRPQPPTPAYATGPHDGEATIAVKSGDSLWRIAVAQLGPGASPAEVARGWRDIYSLNGVVIGPDPNLIRPGQSLRIPIDLKEHNR